MLRGPTDSSSDNIATIVSDGIKLLEKKISDTSATQDTSVTQLVDKLKSLESSVAEIQSNLSITPTPAIIIPTPVVTPEPINKSSATPVDTIAEEVAFVSSRSLFFRQGDDNRDHVDISIKGKDYVGLLDSGAQVNVIGSNWFKDIKDWGEELTHPNLVITTWDRSSRYKPTGVIDVPYTFNGVTRSLPTVVVPAHTEKPVLGKPFMDAFHIRHQQDVEALKLEELEKNKETQVNTVEVSCISAQEFWDFAHYNISSVQLESDDNSSNKDFPLEEIPLEQADEMVPQKEPCVTLPHILTAEQQLALSSVIALFQHTTPTGILNKTPVIEHEIDTGDAKPVMKRQYPLSPYKLERIQKELDKMVQSGILMTIEYSPWRSPIMAVEKRDGGMRIVLDAKELNKVTVPNAYPITDTNTILQGLTAGGYLSSLDLSSAFFQVPLAKNSRNKTAFAFGNRLYCYKRMVMGLRNSPATLAILVDTIFRDLKPFAFAYVDDFIICTKTFEEHLRILAIVARRLAQAGLTISAEKSHFCCRRLEFLGYVLSEDGLSVNPDRIKAILEIPTPTTAKEVRRIVGAAGWYRKFIPNFSEIVAPLNDLYKGNLKGRARIDWNSEADKSFELLKKHLTSAPILTMCDYSKPFKIYCDASLVAAGAVLTQEFDGEEKVVRYYSKKFSKPETNYSATERECLAVILSVEKFRPYIDGVKFTVVSDHAALKWLMNLKDPTGRLARWAIRLQAFDMEIVHKPGKHMELPDALSRAVELIEIKQDTQDTWYKTTKEKATKTELDRYKVENDLLYHRLKFTSHGGQRLWTVCVPTEQRMEVLLEHHDNHSHQGLWKVYRRIKQQYYWPGMHETIYQYIRKCDLCKRTKPSNESTKTPHGQYRDPEIPGRQLSIDLTGPFVMSKKRNRFLFVVLDCFSRFAFAKPLREATSAAIIRYLREVIFPQNGCPEVIISDNGSQFTSKSFEKMCNDKGIEHWKTPVYHPKANQVESTNKNIKNALKIHLAEIKHHSHWEDFIEQVLQDLNTTPHTSTNQTPYFLHHGREFVKHGNEYKMLVDTNPHHTIDPETIQDIREEARELQGDRYEERKVRHSTRARIRNFDIGAEVYIANNKLSSLGQGYNAKLAPSKIRAYVVKKLGENTYTLVDSKQKPLGNHHADQIMTR